MEKSQELKLRILRKQTDFTLINNILCQNEFIIVSDIYRSISVYKYEEDKEKITEVCRDYSPLWCTAVSTVEDNIFMVSDVDGNLFALRKELYPNNDEDRYKLERISQINIGERISVMKNVKKNISVKDWNEIFEVVEDDDKHEKFLNLTYFGTFQGTLGVVISLPKETFNFLKVLQKEILTVIATPGNFDFERWRSFKVNKHLFILGWICFRYL